jgi:hypothetical protein
MVEPPSDGTLVVSTSTVGDDPDPDGFRLTIDGVPSVRLQPTDSVEVAVPAGRHVIDLVGVAGQCSVDPGTPLDVDMAPPDTTPVAFALNCPKVGASVTITTTGLDPDQDGYRIEMDGMDRGFVPSSGSAFIRANLGSRIIALTGLAPNCALAGPDSQTVTIVAGRVTPVTFAASCTATSGVMAVSIRASGTDVEGQYQVIVDGLPQLNFQNGPGSGGISVPGGDHLVYLVAPSNCTVQPGPQSVNVAIGGLTRDTVVVPFSAECVQNTGTLRITAPTSGPLPNVPYTIGLCDDWYCYYGASVLGQLAPNDTLFAQVQASGADILEISNIPPNCVARDPSIQITVKPGDTLDVKFPVQCTP